MGKPSEKGCDNMALAINPGTVIVYNACVSDEYCSLLRLFVHGSKYVARKFMTRHAAVSRAIITSSSSLGVI